MQRSMHRLLALMLALGVSLGFAEKPEIGFLPSSRPALSAFPELFLTQTLAVRALHERRFISSEPLRLSVSALARSFLSLGDTIFNAAIAGTVGLAFGVGGGVSRAPRGLFSALLGVKAAVPQAQDARGSAQRYVQHLTKQLSFASARRELDRSFGIHSGSQELFLSLVRSDAVMEVLVSPLYSVGLKQAILLQLLLNCRENDGLQEADIPRKLRLFMSRMQEDRYRPLGSVGAEVEVMSEIDQPTWDGRAVNAIYGNLLGMWSGTDQRYEFKTYPSYSWRVQQSILRSLQRLRFYGGEDPHQKIWNSLHVSLVTPQSDVEGLERLIDISSLPIELGCLLLFTSYERVYYVLANEVKWIKTHSYSEADIEHLGSETAMSRTEFRSGDISSLAMGSDLGQRLRTIQLLGSAAVLMAKQYGHEKPVSPFERDAVRLYSAFLKNALELIRGSAPLALIYDVISNGAYQDSDRLLVTAARDAFRDNAIPKLRRLFTKTTDQLEQRLSQLEPSKRVVRVAA